VFCCVGGCGPDPGWRQNGVVEAEVAGSGREWTLAAAAGLAALETTVLITVLAFGSYRFAPLLIVVLAVKYVFCFGLLRRRPGAWVLLLLWEATDFLVALTKPGLPLLERSFQAVLAATCLVLLGAASSLFPTPRLPRR
jgi:hypothetical protein